MFGHPHIVDLKWFDMYKFKNLILSLSCLSVSLSPSSASAQSAESCAQSVYNDVRYFMQYDPEQDAHHSPGGSASEVIKMSGGQPIYVANGSRTLLGQSLQGAVEKSLRSGLASMCGSVTGWIQVKAISRYTLGQWSLDMYLAGWDLR